MSRRDVMAPPGGGRLYDQLREIPRGADPGVLVERSDIIEKKAHKSEDLRGSSIRFKGTVNDEGRFALDLDAPGSDSMVRLLETIQSCLTLMPTITREFYGALMVNLASEAEKEDGQTRTRLRNDRTEMRSGGARAPILLFTGGYAVISATGAWWAERLGTEVMRA